MTFLFPRHIIRYSQMELTANPFVLLLFILVSVTGKIVEHAMPEGLCQCVKSHAIRDHRSDSTTYECIQSYLANTYKERWYHEISTDGLSYIESVKEEAGQILKEAEDHRKHGTGRFRHERVRKECRELSGEEKHDLFSAFVAMKNTRINPTSHNKHSENQFDAFARIHTGASLAAAHGGWSFLVWHRRYKFLLETALRRHNKNVALCYWDVTKDWYLDSYTDSPIFTASFFGDSSGSVRSGYFKNWEAENGPLIRNFQPPARSLISKMHLQQLLSLYRYYQIAAGNITNGVHIEGLHNDIHAAIGGHMGDTSTAAYDVIFFVLHTFIDKLFQVFRDHQGPARVSDYPDYGNPLHLPHSPMGGQLNDWTNIMGLTDLFDYTVKYKDVDCEHNCKSNKYFYCNRHSECVARPKQQVDMSGVYNHVPHQRVLDVAYQNTYLLDGKADAGEWAIIPVRVLYLQNQDQYFGCNPIRNGQIDYSYDVYHGPHAAHNRQRSQQSWYHRTTDSGSGATKILVESHGFSYSGTYCDYCIADVRQGISECVAYVGVKKPENGPSIAYLRAYDLHGLVCEPRCLDPNSDTEFYKKCPGVIEVTSEQPQMYSLDIVEAAKYRYMKSEDENGNSKYQKMFITFVCDYAHETSWKHC